MIEGAPIALCFLKNNDYNNCLYLTDENFTVKMKGKTYSYDLNSIKQLHWTNKQLLLPIILGGLTSSLSVVSYMNNLLHPWFLILLFMSGVLAIYYGFIGSPALEIKLKDQKEFYLIREKNIFLQEFTDFVNLYLIRRETPEYFITVTEDEWEKAKKSGYFVVKEPQELFYENDGEMGRILLKINFQLLNGAITYLPDDESHLLKPYITKDIPVSAVSIAG